MFFSFGVLSALASKAGFRFCLYKFMINAYRFLNCRPSIRSYVVGYRDTSNGLTQRMTLCSCRVSKIASAKSIPKPGLNTLPRFYYSYVRFPL